MNVLIIVRIDDCTFSGERKFKRNSFVYLFGETDQNIIEIISLPSSDEKSLIRARLSLVSVSRVRVSR